MTPEEFENTTIGTPRAALGRTREGGLDCFGLVLLYYREVRGIELPDPATDDPLEALACDASRMFKRAVWPIPGDVAYWRARVIGRDGASVPRAGHVGIVTADGQRVMHVGAVRAESIRRGAVNVNYYLHYIGAGGRPWFVPGDSGQAEAAQ